VVAEGDPTPKKVEAEYLDSKGIPVRL